MEQALFKGPFPLPCGEHRPWFSAINHLWLGAVRNYPLTPASPQGQAPGLAGSSFCLRHSGLCSTLLSCYHVLGDLDLKHCTPPQQLSHKRDFLSLPATSFSLLGGDNPGQIFSWSNSHTVGLALDLFLQITLRNNNLRDGRRKFKTKTALTLNFTRNGSMDKHCPPTVDISPAMPTMQSEPLQLI